MWRYRSTDMGSETADANDARMTSTGCLPEPALGTSVTPPADQEGASMDMTRKIDMIALFAALAFVSAVVFGFV
jgi:hypothetical protein